MSQIDGKMIQKQIVVAAFDLALKHFQNQISILAKVINS